MAHKLQDLIADYFKQQEHLDEKNTFTAISVSSLC